MSIQSRSEVAMLAVTCCFGGRPAFLTGGTASADGAGETEGEVVGVTAGGGVRVEGGT